MDKKVMGSADVFVFVPVPVTIDRVDDRTYGWFHILVLVDAALRLHIEALINETHVSSSNSFTIFLNVTRAFRSFRRTPWITFMSSSQYM